MSLDALGHHELMILTSVLLSGGDFKLQMTHSNAGAEIVLGRADGSVSGGNSLGGIKFVGQRWHVHLSTTRKD